MIENPSVIPVAMTVRRSELLSMKQIDKEIARSFFAHMNGKAAATCAYNALAVVTPVNKLLTSHWRLPKTSPLLILQMNRSEGNY